MTRAPVPITSHENERFRSLLKLQQSSRERRKAARSVLDGVHLVSAYLDHLGEPEQVVVSVSGLANPEISALLERFSGKPFVLADGLFRELSSVTTPTGILAVVPTPRRHDVPKTPAACVMLHDIQDPGNLGSILRSAAAAGVEEVYLSRDSVHAWSPRVLRAGMGAHFVLHIYDGVDLPALIRAYPGQVLALARGARRSLYEVDLRGKVALLFGNEGSGLTPELESLAHARVRIPMPGSAESLNVAAAAAVCLFERVRQLVRREE